MSEKSVISAIKQDDASELDEVQLGATGGQQPDSAVRVRTLTMKGESLYTKQKDELYDQVERTWSVVFQYISDIETWPSDLKFLQRLSDDIQKSVKLYNMANQRYEEFLDRSRTETSQFDLEHSFAISMKRHNSLKFARTEIENKTQDLMERASLRSFNKSATSSSHGSSTSLVLAKKKAKAEGAKRSVQFAKIEAETRRKIAEIEEHEKIKLANSSRQKAELDATLEVIKHEQKAAIAEAEVQALEEISEDDNSAHNLSLPHENNVQRTRQYVKDHSLTQAPGPITQSHKETTAAHSTLNKDAQVFTARTQQAPNYDNSIYPTSMNADFTRFLLKKDLLLSRLTNYDDKPETYAVWKASFQSVMHELLVTPMEELDLLVKWLGHESSRHALSLKSVFIRDPEAGVKEIWKRIDTRFGSPELVEAALKAKLNNFPKITMKDPKKLFELSDIVAEIEAVKQNQLYSTLLSYFDSSSGVIPIVSKLPYNIQEKWTTRAVSYKSKYSVTFPPFRIFCDFLSEISQTKNDPSFCYDVDNNQRTEMCQQPRNTVSVKKTDVDPQETDVASKQLDPSTHCLIHKSRHPLEACRGFRALSLAERKEIIKSHGVCYKCCSSIKHLARDCEDAKPCKDCGSERHCTAFHIQKNKHEDGVNQGGEAYTAIQHEKSDTVDTKCTEICGQGFSGKSCARVVLVKVYKKDQPNNAKQMYAILDDQSNASLVKPEFFEIMGITGTRTTYTINSCGGQVQAQGRRATNLIIEAFDNSHKLSLHSVLECDDIPSNRNEIPTPEVAKRYSHLSDIAKNIPTLDPDADILLLVGRDVLEAHHVLDQRIGPQNSPYAQHLKLGWVIIGETCLGKVHAKGPVSVMKTNLLFDGRPSSLTPCERGISVAYTEPISRANVTANYSNDIFQQTKEDNNYGLSSQDQEFLAVMDKEFIKGDSGNWIAPLPFKVPRPKLPNNKSQALKRAKLLEQSFRRNPEKKKHMRDFMGKVFERKHAEPAPPLNQDEEVWYLPIFGVYHPKKKAKIRAVFDSSACYQGTSLNDVLLKGPNLTNNLVGVLLRFRREEVAVVSDIEQMFHGFLVREDHRNFLRFFWYRNNDPDLELMEYRMRVHVFGNSPSPAIATYGLRRAAEDVKEIYGQDVADFVERNFYVDDSLGSFTSTEQAIKLTRRTQEALKEGGNLRLHKIASNKQHVLESFPSEDRAEDLKGLSLETGTDEVPMQRSLGLSWQLQTDTFTFEVNDDKKPYTRRGVLSTINSLFDPLGFAAPVIIEGKLIFKELMSGVADWDQHLPVELQDRWERWRSSLKSLEKFNAPRPYVKSSVAEATVRELHVFSDASEKAIGAVVYLKTTDSHGESQVGFVLGKTKLAPTHGHTIPRLELCAAVLAVHLAEFVTDNIDVKFDDIRFHTDSRIVLGYINNQTRRFHVYVGNRVDRIKKTSRPDQWNYVPTTKNPADLATRCLEASQLEDSCWISGPAFLAGEKRKPSESFDLVDPEQDQEIRREVSCLKTDVPPPTTLGVERFAHFSSWKSLVRACVTLKHIAHSYTKRTKCHGWHTCGFTHDLEARKEAEKIIISEVQRAKYSREIHCLQKNTAIPRDSSLKLLNPYIDEDGLLRVGGRLAKSDLPYLQRKPLIIPGNHHVALLLIRLHHEQVYHQGRHITEGAVRAAGLWITGAKRLITSLIHKCVQCRKLRGKFENQMMADLPRDRLTPSPPFSYVGLDVFGHWSIVTRRTRGGSSNSKRWAVLFTCMSTRAIHIEVIEDMTSSCFINAMRRFLAIRGKVVQFRSDRGTNFTGATDNLGVQAINVEDKEIQAFLDNSDAKWIFNPPHSSHMGGVWERMIGVVRRVLEGVMSNIATKNLTHEVLVTFMAEVTAIVNSRPIVPVSTDPENPEILTPTTLLTQKFDSPVPPLENCDINLMYKAQWKRVQLLADTFWKRWRKEYIHSLQTRRKWTDSRPNLAVKDVVLLKDQDTHRSQWPVGIVQDAIPADDGRVRKVVLRVTKNGVARQYTRPVTEVVALVSKTL